MFCRKCGTLIADDSAFCTKCGTKVVIPKASETKNNDNLEQKDVPNPIRSRLFESYNHMRDLYGNKIKYVSIIIFKNLLILTCAFILVSIHGWFSLKINNMIDLFHMPIEMEYLNRVKTNAAVLIFMPMTFIFPLLTLIKWAWGNRPIKFLKPLAYVLILIVIVLYMLHLYDCSKGNYDFLTWVLFGGGIIDLLFILSQVRPSPQS